MFGLPFREVWCIDFEFVAPPGERPTPVCLVGREMVSGRLIRLWADELRLPFDPIDPQVLIVAYFASAEWSCFLALGWPLPVRILDLYVEFRKETNGLQLPAGRGLLGALSHHGLTSITKQEKTSWRDRIMAGPPYSSADRAGILDYCQSDVEVLGPLLERMLPAMELGRALLRGRYTAAVARIEHTGVPVDVGTLADLVDGWAWIKAELIAAVDADFGVYDGTSFRQWRFREYLAREGIAWPLTSTGQLALDADTFRDQARRHPQLYPLKELRSTLGELRLADLAVGSDGRNRTLLSPFASLTGRNQPSNSRFVFGPSVWIRHLIVPPPGRAVAYIDWTSQEVAIAAALSGDSALLDAVASGDVYLSFAKRAQLVPADATKTSHKATRDRCKVAVLGSNYGMGPGLLAAQMGTSTIEAAGILQRLRATFPTYFAWADDNVNRAQLTGSIETVLGWKYLVTPITKPTTLQNWQMQAHGSEMLRLACCLTTEFGIEVCAPVHDALLIEADAREIDQAVAETRRLMAEASKIVLDGVEVATDVEVIGPGERYADPRGAVLWSRLVELLEWRKVAELSV